MIIMEKQLKWNIGSDHDHHKRLLIKNSSWDINGGSLSFEKDRAYGYYSWPQKNYICTFCKKEFKSAQALGGHMNVHRRDRARLMRLSSPSSSLEYSSTFFNNIPNPSPNPNPNPSLIFSSNSVAPTIFPEDQDFKIINGHPPLITEYDGKVSVFFEDSSKHDHEEDDDDIILKKICGRDDEFHKGKKNQGEVADFARKNDARVWKGDNDHHKFVNLDLSMGLIKEGEEDLDLELRLGYS